MAQTENPDEWSQLLTPESLAELGGTSFAPPGGSFDPAGSWTQTWQIWLLKRSPRDTNHRGFIQLQRKAAENADHFELVASQVAVQRSQGAVHETLAEIRCAADSLATPLEWSIRARMYSVWDERQIDAASYRKRGARRDTGVSGPVSSSWSILEAIQRAGVTGEARAFTLLDELDKPKPGYRLTEAGKTEIPFGGESMPVRRYHLIGQGLLPTVYYVDENRRLLLALSGLRAYILNPEAQQTHSRLLAKLAMARRGK